MQSWVNLDPPKSTVKRVLKEDSEKGSPNASWSNINKQYHKPQKKSEVVSSELSSASGAFLNHHKSTGMMFTRNYIKGTCWCE